MATINDSSSTTWNPNWQWQYPPFIATTGGSNSTVNPNSTLESQLAILIELVTKMNNNIEELLDTLTR